MITHNPSKTKTLTESWFRDINKRWSEFKSKAVSELKSENKIAVNEKEIFSMSPSQIRIYMQFYSNLVNELLLGTTKTPNWQAKYQLDSYMRSVARARADLIAQGLQLEPTLQESAFAMELSPEQFTAIPSLGVAATTTLAPIHADSLEFLFSRSYSTLKGWTDKMEVETRQILTDAVAQGKGITETVNEMTARINVSKSRAQVIARTEIIQAHQIGSINEVERLEEETGEELDLIWISALLVGRTRDLHWQWHGDVISKKEARRRIGVSPWNCLCALRAAISSKISKKKEAQYKEEKEEFRKLEDNRTSLKVNSIMFSL